jgi:choloylglycine hydrolase
MDSMNIIQSKIFRFSSIVYLTFFASMAFACTAIILESKNDTVVQARTMEWGTFDLESTLMVVDKGVDFVGLTPDGKDGFRWKSKYGVLGINVAGKPLLTDGMNEKGLGVSVLYHPGFAEYQKYIPSKASESLGSQDVALWILSTFSTIEEVRLGLPKIRVVPVKEVLIGNIAPPIHLLITDISGKTIVVEYLKGKLEMYDNPVGVLTNSPEFPWHLTNLRNYVGIRPAPQETIKVGDLELSPLGAGSGMIGLPGDFSPPSRFVRAVALTNSVLPLTTSQQTVEEAFRILNNFDIPLGSTASHADLPEDEMQGSTQWVSVMELTNLKYYYHTMFNSRIRMIDMNDINFNSGNDIRYYPLDAEQKEDMEIIKI